MTFYNNNTVLVLPLSKGIYTTQQPFTKEVKLFLGDYKLTSYITTTIRPNTTIQKLKVWQLRNDYVRTLQQTNKGLQTWTE